MFYNKSLHHDCMPEIEIVCGQPLEVVEEYKILGLVISSDMKWNSHVKYICKKGYTSLWMIRRLKKCGTKTDILLDLYHKHTRSSWCNPGSEFWIYRSNMILPSEPSERLDK